MANNSDGSIVLSVNIDTSTLKSQTDKVSKEVLNALKSQTKFTKETENSYQELQGTIKVQEQALQSLKEKYASLVLQKQQNSDEAKKLRESIKNLSGELDENRKKLENSRNAANVFDKSMSKVKNATNSAIAGLKKIASALGIYLGLREIIRFSNEASKLVSQQEANLKRLSMLYGENTKQVYDFVNANSTAFGMSKTAAYQAATDYGNLFRTFSDGAESAKLTNDMLKATAVIASQTGRTYEDVFEKIRSGLYGNTRAIDDLGITVRKAGLMKTQAFQTVSGGIKSWNDLTDAELQHARTLGIIEQAYSHYGNTVLQTTALTRSQFNAAWTDFKATWGQAVNLVLIPILTVATKILTTITAVMQKIFHLTGKQIDTSSKVTANIGGAVSKQDDLTDSIGKTNKALKDTNKELKKELASFDELEILSRNTSDNAGGSVSGGTGGGASTVGGDSADSGNTIINQGEIDAKLATIAAVSGMALIGLGILVMFSGHPFYGLTMIGLGVMTVYTAAEMAEKLDIDVKSKLIKIFDIVGKVAFMLGCILLFLPNCWKFGLGLMALGASALGFSNELSNGNFANLKEKLSKIILLVGIVSFMIGLILLFLPNCLNFGLGLMVKGAIAVGVSAALGGEELKKDLEDFCTSYWELLYTVGIIMVCVGVVLLFVAAAATWKIALTLILVGIADIVETTLLGGEELKKELETFCKEYWKELVAIGAIMVCVGVVVLFTGHPLVGLALIGVGIAALVSETKLKGTDLKKELETFCKEYWKEIYVASYLMLIVGIILCFTPFTLTGVGMIIMSATLIGGNTYFGWDEIKKGFTEMADSINQWIEKYDLLLFILGIILCFTPLLPVGIYLLKKSGKSLFGEEELSFETLKEKLITQLGYVYDAVSKQVEKIKNKIAEIGKGGKASIGGGGITTSGGGGTRGESRSVTRQSMPIDSVSYKVPALARGAVIPANRQFLAVLGDQKRGTNIEAPAELIKQMAKEAIAEMGGIDNQNQVVREEHYNLNETELMTIMYKLVKGGERINGTSLVKQGGI